MPDQQSEKTFVQRSLRVTRRQKMVFDVFMAGLLPQTVSFAVHLIASALGRVRRSKPGYVPIASTFVQAHFRGAEIDTLVERRIIVVEEFDRAGGKSREYRPSGQFIQAFLEAGPRLESVGSETYVDLATGKPSKRPPVSVLTDPNRNPAPELVQRAIRSVTTSLVNMPAVVAHVARLQASFLALPEGPEKARAASRYLADLSCLNTVLAQGARPTGVATAGAPSEIWEYTPAYSPQKYGRVSELGGGLQNASRAMKEAARSGIAECRNYDMEASQARLLQVAMREAGTESAWVDRYLNTPGAKHDAAARSGLSVDTWKTVFYAILMGARVPAPGQTAFSDGKVVAAIHEEVGDDRFDEVYGAFYEFVRPLLDDIRAWHDHLEGTWVEANGHVSNVDKKTRITNAVGAVVAVEDLVVPGKPHKLRSRLASFVLTGMEASFCHRLAHAFSQSGKVLSLEHDGLIVIGEITDEMVAQAVRDAGLPENSVKLVEKPFV